MNQILAEARTDPVVLAVEMVRIGPSPRNRIDARQVAALAELRGHWDPIVVEQATMIVIDGRHRLTAARRLGHAVIGARLFCGSEAEARIEAVRLNVRHGLPLSLTERTIAARDLLALLADPSDRYLGDICGLSPRTIARIRQDVSQQRPSGDVDDGLAPIGEDWFGDKRIGRDGRRYPRDPVALRREIRRLLEQDRNASLRAIAAKAGASPETVRAVRHKLSASFVPSPAVVQPPEQVSRWSEDAACSSTLPGRQFAQWFDEHQLDEALMGSMVAGVPLNRLHGAIDEANRRKRFWEAFAEELQRRVCGGNTPKTLEAATEVSRPVVRELRGRDSTES